MRKKIITIGVIKCMDVWVRKGILRGINIIFLYSFFVLTIILFLYSYESQLFTLRLLFLEVAALVGFAACIIKRRCFFPIQVATFILINWLLCALLQEQLNYEWSNLLYTLSYVGLASLLIISKDNLTVTAGLIIWGFLTIGIKLLQGVPVQNILLQNSENYISVLLLFLIIPFYLARYRRGKSIPLIPAIIYFLICVLVYGRGGILTSGFLLIALCLYKLHTIKNKWIKRSIILLILCCGGIILISIVEQEFLEKWFSKFYTEGVNDSARLEIWTQFLQNNKESFDTVLVGSNIFRVRLDGNLHNFLLQAYASFGLIGALGIIVEIIKALWRGIKQREILWVILFLTLLIRAFTDRVFFQGYCEVFLYYFIMYWKLENKNIGRREK